MTERHEEKRPAGTPRPSAGSAEPGPEQAPPRADLDPDRLAAGGSIPRGDALDPGDPGAPVAGPGSGAADGPGPGARHAGGAGGSGAVVGPIRDRGQDLAEDEEAPAGGGPGAGFPRGERTSDES